MVAGVSPTPLRPTDEFGEALPWTRVCDRAGARISPQTSRPHPGAGYVFGVLCGGYGAGGVVRRRLLSSLVMS